MSNKQQLQLNNETLASILSNVLGLPSQESLKRGAYVWKKYEYIPKVEVTNPVFTYNTTRLSATVTFTNPNFDFSNVNEDNYIKFLEDFTFNGTIMFIVNSNGQLYNSGTGGYFVFVSSTSDALTLQLGNTTASQTQSYECSYSGTKVISESHTGDFIDFVVSDNPTAYPDGGLQGGYWYKLVKEIDPLNFGFTKVAIDKFTFSSDKGATTIYHSLGEKPKFVMIYGEPSSTVYVQKAIGLTQTDNSGDTSAYGVFVDSASAYNDFSFAGVAETNFIMGNSNIRWQAGVEYTLITMA